ncbi:tetratricopeptide repeat protein [Spirillospora sp. NBC_01491]|uniref:tetratricopeptide repeat protein n=1 Tax=Spirillospora sp. NBC_01491 TaxID=2976007 RepID=UPI002E2EA952|nr:tetratricopeptide repeat protein [Spirillospora sp. NBC_01491]
MPSADELTPAQASRRATVLDLLTSAGWTPDNALWDAGISTDFVAGVQLRGAGTAQRCDYMITEKGDLTEYLNVRWNLPDGETQLIIDFLGQSSGSETDLGTVLAALASERAQEGDRPAATVAALPPDCPLFTLDEYGRLAPVNEAAAAGTATSPAANAEIDEADADEDDEDDEVEYTYGDEVQSLLDRELRAAGWRRTPNDMLLMGLRESFYVQRGSVTLSAGRWNGEETSIRLEGPEGEARLRLDGLAAPQDAHRLVALLIRWQELITEDNWQDFVNDLLAAYPHVYTEGDDGDWHRLALPAAEPVREPQPGVEDRTRLIRETLGGAGWTQQEPPGGSPLCMILRTSSGASLTCIHSVEPPEILLLDVQLPEGTGSDFGGNPMFALDMMDLWSGGGRDRLEDVLGVLTTAEHAFDARGLTPLVQALQLRCRVLWVRDGVLGTIVRAQPEFGGEPAPPLPRPLREMDRVVATPEGDTAEGWCERGHAALGEHRPDLALESFDAALDRDPDHACAHYHRAWTIGTADLEETHRSFYRSVELDFAVGPSLLHYAQLMRLCGYPEQETITLRHAVERLPEYAPGWYTLSLTAVKAGRYDECVTAATRALELMPRDARALHCRACGYALRGDSAEALADVAAAIETDPSFRTEMRDDPDFGALRDDPRFVALVDPWPASDAEGSLPSELVEVLRPAGWRPDDRSVSGGRVSSVEYPCPAGRLIFGLSAGTCYVNLRPSGRGEGAEGWLYAGAGDDARVLAGLLTGWQDRLDGDNFPEFAKEVGAHLAESTWHLGHP